MSDGSTAFNSATGIHSVEDFDESTAEHISLGDEFAARDDGARTVSERLSLKDALRGRETQLTFFRQGFLEVVEKRGGKSRRCVPIDLRYLDPTPRVERIYPHRLFRTACIAGGLAIVLATLAAFGVATLYTATATAIAITATIVAGIACFYRSQERFRFYTQHGRAMALQLEAGLGYVGRYRNMLPTLVGAIETAADAIGEDTTVYLRAEMREHYRLRGVGVLSDSDCSDSTARILAHFDEPT